MSLEQHFTKKQTNIKDLAINVPKDTTESFNFDKLFSPAECDKIKSNPVFRDPRTLKTLKLTCPELLDKMNINWDEFFSKYHKGEGMPISHCYFKIIDNDRSKKIIADLNENMWQSALKHITSPTLNLKHFYSGNHNGMDYDYRYLLSVMMLFPDRKGDLKKYIRPNKIQDLQKEIEAAEKRGGSVSKVFGAKDPERRMNKDSASFYVCTSYFKLLFPEEYDEMQLDREGQMSHISKLLPKIKEFDLQMALELALAMKILSHDRVEITEKGLEFINNKVSFVDQQRKELPIKRKF